MDKKKARIRRTIKVRNKIRELNVYRLCVHRTPRHVYAQIIAPDSKVVASASTVEEVLRASIEGYTGNIAAATKIGTAIAERAKAVGIEKVAFDRSGFRYHGRVKALADAARANGLRF